MFGGGDWAKFRIVPDCVKARKDNKSVIIRNPNSTRPWQHVLEPLSGYLHLASRLKSNEILNGQSFNFGPLSMNNKTVKELLIGISSHWNLKISPFKLEKIIPNFMKLVYYN